MHTVKNRIKLEYFSTWDYGEGMHNALVKLFSFNTPLDVWQQLVIAAILLILLSIIVVITYFVIRKILFNIIQKLVSVTKNTWDDELMVSNIFKWLSMLAPAAIIWHTSAYIFFNPLMKDINLIGSVIRVASQVSLVLLILFSINSVLNIIERIYNRHKSARQLPVKSIIQVIKTILVLIGIIFIISTIAGKSPLLIFSGLGAMTAILMLIFKDSILGLIAGIQLSANRMVATGDWIEIPKFGADGEVLEVALTTVKVRNWDKTITTIPTYALISDSFKNWRGMSSSGLRRIKRHINIDIASISFLDPELLAKMKNIKLLQNYLQLKEAEIEKWNTDRDIQHTDPINARALTNLGTFRAYVNEFLKSHPLLSQKETLIVRQLQPTEHGLPLEIYTFCLDNRWAEYENVQADIFDHLYAVLQEFRLSAFQNPSGADLAVLGEL